MQIIPSREQMKLTGVYCICNGTTGKVYIGSAARSFTSRLSRHRINLMSNTHNNRHLQSAWNKYGADDFEFRILRITAPHEAVEYEQAFIDLHKAADRKCGYNLAPIAGSNLGVKHTAKTKSRISAVKRGRKHTAEARSNMSAAQKGKFVGPETRAKLSTALRGKTRSAETRAKVSVAASNPSPETRAKMSAAQKKRSPEVQARMTHAVRNRSPEVLEKMASSARAFFADPAVRAAHSIRQKATHGTVAMRAAMSERMKVIQGTPAARLANSERQKRLFDDPFRKAEMLAKRATSTLRNKLTAASAMLPIIDVPDIPAQRTGDVGSDLAASADCRAGEC